MSVLGIPQQISTRKWIPNVDSTPISQFRSQYTTDVTGTTGGTTLPSYNVTGAAGRLVQTANNSYTFSTTPQVSYYTLSAMAPSDSVYLLVGDYNAFPPTVGLGIVFSNVSGSYDVNIGNIVGALDNITGLTYSTGDEIALVINDVDGSDAFVEMYINGVSVASYTAAYTGTPNCSGVFYGWATTGTVTQVASPAYPVSSGTGWDGEFPTPRANLVFEGSGLAAPITISGALFDNGDQITFKYDGTVNEILNGQLKYLDGVSTNVQTQLNAKGSGTVTSVSVATANGVSGTVANSSTTPAITLSLGAITPTSVNSITLSGSSTPTLAVTGTSSISGSNTGDQNLQSILTTSISDGDTTHAPDGNSVFDALALKVSATSPILLTDVTMRDGVYDILFEPTLQTIKFKDNNVIRSTVSKDGIATDGLMSISSKNGINVLNNTTTSTNINITNAVDNGDINLISGTTAATFIKLEPLIGFSTITLSTTEGPASASITMTADDTTDLSSIVMVANSVTLPAATSIGPVTSTEIGYLDNVTSSIQPQINSKAYPKSIDNTVSPGYFIPYATGGAAITTVTWVATRLGCIPFYAQTTETITELGCRVNTGVAAAQCLLGIADADVNNMPGTTLFSTALLSAAVSGTSISEACSVNLVAGNLYFALFWCDSNAIFNALNLADIFPIFGNSGDLSLTASIKYQSQGAVGLTTLPNPVVPVSNITTTFPAIFFKR